MIVSERIGVDSPSLRDLGQDWIGPLISSFATVGLTVYKGLQEKKAAKKVKKEEAKAVAAEAAQALFEQQPTARMLTDGQRAPTGAPGAGIPWTTIAVVGAGVLGLGVVAILFLKK